MYALQRTWSPNWSFNRHKKILSLAHQWTLKDKLKAWGVEQGSYCFNILPNRADFGCASSLSIPRHRNYQFEIFKRRFWFHKLIHLLMASIVAGWPQNCKWVASENKERKNTKTWQKNCVESHFLIFPGSPRSFPARKMIAIIAESSAARRTYQSLREALFCT